VKKNGSSPESVGEFGVFWRGEDAFYQA